MTATVSDNFRKSFSQLSVPPRLLLGPGPSNAHPRVLQAMGMRQLGHLDPEFLEIMDRIQELMRYVWQTENEVCIPVSGTGSAAMEAAIANLVEPGDKVLIAVNGYFGLRMADMAERYGAEVVMIRKPWGKAFSLREISEAVVTNKPVLLGIVHAETSTGVRQELEGLGELCRANHALLLVDTVTSMGGVPLFIDDWKIDAAYAGSQKCLSCPPGISPLTIGDRAMEKIGARPGKVKNWYLDLSMLTKYWGRERTYHHTAPISMTYGLYEALRLVAEEGLEARWERHRNNAGLLVDELRRIGLKPFVSDEIRLSSLITVKVPEEVDPKRVSNSLLDDYNIEIGNGLGELAGKIWRIGLMGFNSRPENVAVLVAALEKILNG
jgi:alanine-glyoxylate transaminase/serine-glyoxylate transaminase/serine-pyruvate transaminase